MKKLNHFAVYDELPLWSAPFGLNLLEKVRFRKNIKILDIGSGSGFPMLELAERFGSSCQVFGLDPSDDAVMMIKEKIDCKQISNAAIIKSTAEEIPFDDLFFDLITANNGLNNVQDEAKALAECYRVASAGAQMVVTMNLPHTMTEFYEVFREILDSMGLSDRTMHLEQHIFQKRKPVEFWQDKITDAGFRIKKIDIDGFRLRFADGTTFLNHYFIRTAFMDAWRTVAGEEFSEVFSRTTGKLNEKAAEEGEIAMSIPFVCFDCYK